MRGWPQGRVVVRHELRLLPARAGMTPTTRRTACPGRLSGRSGKSPAGTWRSPVRSARAPSGYASGTSCGRADSPASDECEPPHRGRPDSCVPHASHRRVSTVR
ncbi:MAG TPA: hypothetical protein DD420_05450 [Streptomyces sp.]|nr:hypothetical protein [Streptomyces sp.]